MSQAAFHPCFMSAILFGAVLVCRFEVQKTASCNDIQPFWPWSCRLRCTGLLHGHVKRIHVDASCPLTMDRAMLNVYICLWDTCLWSDFTRPGAGQCSFTPSETARMRCWSTACHLLGCTLSNSGIDGQNPKHMLVKRLKKY